MVAIDPRNLLFVDVQYLIEIVLMRFITINLFDIDTVIFI